ncbi:hypothetical protein MCEMSEM23_02304 [Rhabdaerophilaceae bacterium]
MSQNPAQPMMALNVSALRERLYQIRGAAQQIESLQDRLQSEIRLISTAVADMDKLTSPPPVSTLVAPEPSSPHQEYNPDDLSQLLENLEPDDSDMPPVRLSRMPPGRSR